MRAVLSRVSVVVLMRDMCVWCVNSGPYSWVPPNYWLEDTHLLGGAFGFLTEVHRTTWLFSLM